MPHVNVVDDSDDELSREATLSRVLGEEHRDCEQHHNCCDGEPHLLAESESLEVKERPDRLNNEEHDVEDAEKYVDDEKNDS